MRSKSHLYDMLYQIYQVDPVTEDIIETIGAMDPFQAAQAAFDAALTCRPGATLQMRQKARVVRTETAPQPSQGDALPAQR